MQMKPILLLSTSVILAVVGLYLVADSKNSKGNAGSKVIVNDVDEHASMGVGAETAGVSNPNVDGKDLANKSPQTIGSGVYDPEDPSTYTVTQHPYIIQANDENPRAYSVWEAHTTGKHPERISAFVPAKPFDEKAFRKNPAAYLNIVEPSRIDQMHKPGPDVPLIEAESPYFQRIQPHATVNLSVQAIPDAPVSWVTTRGGLFTESKASAVTVRADKKGVATVTFFATPGTINETEILAVSPMTYGRVKMIVSINESLAKTPTTSQPLNQSTTVDQK